MPDSFGAALRRFRLAANLTQEALAERAGLSPTAIASLERGRSRAPRLSTLRQLASALELGPADLAELSRLAQAGEDRAGDAGAAAGGPSGGRPAGPVRLPGLAARVWRTGFVGRDPDLERLGSAWIEHTRILEILGEPGIGKSRLAGRLAHWVYDKGGTVLWGRCHEERLGAYLPFVEALRQLVTDGDPAVLAAAIGRRGELTRLVPELADRVGPLDPPTQAEAGTEQRLLFEAVGAVLRPWLPMLLVLDDLHWADESSLALLGFLARDHDLDGLTVLVTARPADLAPGPAGRLADLGREASMRRVALTGLHRETLGTMLSDAAGSTVSAAVVASVAEITEGNPFFAEEMIVHLVDAALLRPSESGLALREGVELVGIPDRLRETLERRILALPADTVELISVGSVIGREFDLDLASAASGIGGSGLVDAAEAGLLSGLLIETGPGRLSFSHALVQQAVGQRQSHLRRAQFHRRVAEEMAGGRGQEPAAPAQLARHWSEVAAVDPSARATAAAWTVRAGDLALAAAASDEAIARYQEATEQWADGTRDHADALVRLGEALQHRGRADEADERFREATHLAVALHDPVLQARAAIGLGRRYPYMETDSDRIAVLEAALAALPADEDARRLTLMGYLVTQLVNGFHPEEADRRDQLADELGALAASTTDAEILLSVGHTRVFDCIEDPDVLTAVAGRLVTLAQSRNDLRVLAGARFAEALAALDAGDMGGLLAAADAYSEAAHRLDDPRERSQAATVQATIALVQGRYSESESLAADAFELGRASGDFNAELVHYGQGLLRAVDMGLAPLVLSLLADATDYQNIAAFASGTALVAALAGDRALARETLARLTIHGFQSRPRGADRLSSTAFLAHACVLLEASEFAAPLYESLGRTAATTVRVGPLVGWWGPLDHHLGALGRLLGRRAESEGHLRRAIRIEESMQAWPFLARSAAQLSALLAAEDPAGAAASAEQSRSAATRSGADGITAEVEALLAGGRL